LTQVQYFASINVAEQIFDALLTWDLIGKLEVTKVSLKFFRQIDKTIKIGTYSKDSRTYNQLTTTIRDWAENTLLSLRPRTPPDLILPLVMNNRTGEPMLPPIGPNGALRSQVAVLGIHNSYNGVIPPSWANGYPTRKPKNPWGRKPGHGSKHCDGSSDFEDQYAFDYGYE
jgi:glucoamylase